MSCNTNASIEELKGKLTEIKPPKIDISSLNSKVSEALAEADGKINSALGSLEEGIGGAVKQAGTKLQDELAKLQQSGDLESLNSQIAEIKKKFGEGVANLDSIISESAGALQNNLSGGIDSLIDAATDGIDSALKTIESGEFADGFKEAQDKLGSFLNGNLQLPDVCKVCPNIEALPSGEIIEQPTKEVTPTAPPIEPVPKPAVTVNNQQDVELQAVAAMQIALRYNSTLYNTVIGNSKTKEDKIRNQRRTNLLEQQWLYTVKDIMGYDNISQCRLSEYMAHYTDKKFEELIQSEEDAAWFKKSGNKFKENLIKRWDIYKEEKHGLSFEDGVRYYEESDLYTVKAAD